MGIARREAMRAALSLALFVSLAPGIALAADATLEAAHKTYLRYCGSCHGAAGEGDGMVAAFLTPKPPDLTQLATKSGGTFPAHKVMTYIDGTSDVRAHGDSSMPVWGEVFKAEAAWDHARRAEVQGKLLLITEYLRSIQAK
jgi:mono/diheme cytochrome c family protein